MMNDSYNNELDLLETKYEEETKSLTNRDLSTYMKLFYSKESGIKGEDRACEILKKYCDEIKENVIVWCKNKHFTTEVDFICYINGYILMIEVKNWYGTLTLSSDNYVDLSFQNVNGRYKNEKRFNPVVSLGSFSADFRAYLKRYNIEPNNNSIIRFVLFIRDELIIRNKECLKEHQHILRLNDLEDFLIDIKNRKPGTNTREFMDYLPTWDLTRSFRNGFYQCLILNDTIKIDNVEYKTSDIKSLTFLKFTENAKISFRDGRVIYGFVDRREIDLINHKKLAFTDVDYVLFNNLIHK